MWNTLKNFYQDWILLDGIELLDEAYMELNVDNELGRGYW